MIKVAINPHHKNKMPSGLTPTEMRQWWAEFNGGFVNMKFPTVAQFIRSINAGHAYTAQHAHYRKAANFLCGQHIGLDFDTGDYRSSFEELLEDKFIRENASFLHTTASYTYDAPRSRAVFILEKPIYTTSKYSILTEAFANTYTSEAYADPSCKDPVRIFFGAEKCAYKYLGNILSLYVAANEIVLPYKERTKFETTYSMNKLFEKRRIETADPDKLEHLRDSLLENIAMAPDGNKHTTLIRISRTFGGYIAAGYFDEEETKQRLYTAIASRPTTKNLSIAWNAIEFGVDSGKREPLYIEEETDAVLKQLFFQ